MRDPLPQGVFQSLQDVDSKAKGFERLQLLADLQKVAKVPALDELHQQEVKLAFGSDFVDRDDVRVLQPLANFSLAAEQVYKVLVARPAISQNLDPDLFLREQLLSAIEAGETPRGDRYISLQLPRTKPSVSPDLSRST